jgi:hypothetical protein
MYFRDGGRRTHGLARDSRTIPSSLSWDRAMTWQPSWTVEVEFTDVEHIAFDL